MKIFTQFLIVISLFSCTLFKKNKNQISPDKSTFYFTDIGENEISKKEYIFYEIKKDGYKELQIFPKNNSAYCDFEYILSEETFGSYKYIPIVSATKKNIYTFNFIGDSGVYAPNNQNIFLSELNYDELQKTGKTNMQLYEDSAREFSVDSMYNEVFQMDSIFKKIPIVVASNKATKYRIYFLPHKNYPIILAYQGKFEFTTAHEKKHWITKQKFELKPKFVLKYKIVEGGGSAYTYVTLENRVLNDSIVTCKVSGNYEGSYQFNINQNITYYRNAITNPIFSIPMFSVDEENILEKKYNWFLFSKSLIENAVKSPTYFNISHFVTPLEMMDTSAISQEELIKIKHDIANSDKTQMQYFSYGMYLKKGFSAYPERLNDSAVYMDALHFFNKQYEVDIVINNDGKFPFLVHYDDHKMYKISLEDFYYLGN